MSYSIAKSHTQSLGGRGPSLLLRLWLQLETWQERSRQRHALGQLGDHALKDIGLSYSDVLREAEKPFWQA